MNKTSLSTFEILEKSVKQDPELHSNETFQLFLDSIAKKNINMEEVNHLIYQVSPKAFEKVGKKNETIASVLLERIHMNYITGTSSPMPDTVFHVLNQSNMNYISNEGITLAMTLAFNNFCYGLSRHRLMKLFEKADMNMLYQRTYGQVCLGCFICEHNREHLKLSNKQIFKLFSKSNLNSNLLFEIVKHNSNSADNISQYTLYRIQKGMPKNINLKPQQIMSLINKAKHPVYHFNESLAIQVAKNNHLNLGLSTDEVISIIERSDIHYKDRRGDNLAYTLMNGGTGTSLGLSNQQLYSILLKSDPHQIDPEGETIAIKVAKFNEGYNLWMTNEQALTIFKKSDVDYQFEIGKSLLDHIIRNNKQQSLNLSLEQFDELLGQSVLSENEKKSYQVCFCIFTKQEHLITNIHQEWSVLTNRNLIDSTFSKIQSHVYNDTKISLEHYNAILEKIDIQQDVVPLNFKKNKVFSL